MPKGVEHKAAADRAREEIGRVKSAPPTFREEQLGDSARKVYALVGEGGVDGVNAYRELVAAGVESGLKEGEAAAIVAWAWYGRSPDPDAAPPSFEPSVADEGARLRLYVRGDDDAGAGVVDRSLAHDAVAAGLRILATRLTGENDRRPGRSGHHLAMRDLAAAADHVAVCRSLIREGEPAVEIEDDLAITVFLVVQAAVDLGLDLAAGARRVLENLDAMDGGDLATFVASVDQATS